MKRALILSIAFGALVGLGGCTGYYGGAGVGYGYNAYDDLYYDNYYGPVSYGYWGNDGWYYYRDRVSRQYRRDDGRHFRRDAADGYHASRMHRGRDNGHGERRNDSRRHDRRDH